MPIVSKTLIKVANREDISPGWKRWCINGKDSTGRLWVYGSFGGTQADAEEVLAGVSWDLSEADLVDVLRWVQARNTVASFDYTDRDITKADAEEHIFKWFAEADGEEAITVAWWMDDINTGKFNSIRDRVGYTGTQGADITSRFTFMVAVEPWYQFTIKAP